jgi:hypothetical protein
LETDAAASCGVLNPPLRGIVQLTNSATLRFRNWSFTINPEKGCFYMKIKGTFYITIKTAIAATFGEERWNSFMTKLQRWTAISKM